MCGICGFIGHQPDSDRLVKIMAARMPHRGPDSAGEWVDPEAGIALAHRRLAIVDLSAAGHQPMTSRDGRYILSYNGEIYNHADLRAKLAAGAPINWRGHSDTETLLEGFSTWGIEDTLRRCNGMFAIALWDRKERCLHLARDRMGEKPLYWGRLGSDFVFASELKALRAHPGWMGRINRDALALYFRHNYVPGPWCIHEGLHKLPPAHWLTVQANGQTNGPKPYWSLEEAATRGQQTPFAGSAQDAVDALEHLLRDAIGLRMMADVPLGAFLSGGYDSSTVVALMQAQATQPVRTFSIGFHEKAYDEAQHARRVSSHLGTQHTELYLSPQDAMSVIPELPKIWDEPFADSSQIPTLLVSRMAREHVIVSLSGDGGDELFCGYSRYATAQRIWSSVDRMPRPLRPAVATGLQALTRMIPGSLLNALPGGGRLSTIFDRLGKGADLLRMAGPENLYHTLVSHDRNPEHLVLGAREPQTLLTDRSRWPAMRDMREQFMYFDSLTYLPDDILVKLDRASMAVSLESRVPLLDHRIVEFAFALPLEMKLRDGCTKWALREVLHRHVPKSLMDRPKMGFGVPIEEWLRGPIREWAGDLLAEDRLKRDGYLDAPTVSRMWQEHQSGTRRWHYRLWDILMFQAWLEDLPHNQIARAS